MFGATSTFGGTAPTFGATSFTGTNTANPFGATQQPGTTSLFGGTTGFNSPRATGFGAPFGSPQQSTSLFGQQNRLGGNTTMFGNTSAVVSPFGTALPQAQGTSIPFTAITGSDTMMKNGVASPINTRHQCITCMKEYEQKSLEELRFEDYQLGRKGTNQQQGTVFGASQAQPTGLFSSIAPATNTVTGFGQTRPTATFGSVAPQPSSTGLFSNLNQPKTNFFGTPTTNTFGSTNSGFTGFAAPQPQQQQSIFGQTNPATSTMGTTGFSFNQPAQQQPQQQQMGLGPFGQKPLIATGATSAPFGFGTQTNQTMTKPNTLFNTTPTFSSGFGTTAPPTTNIFSNTPVSKPFSFGIPASTAPSFTFPNPTVPAFSTGGTSLFGAQTTTTPSTGFSAFGSAPITTSNTGFTGFGNTSFGAPPSTGFSFNAGSTFGQPNPFQPPAAPATGPVPFATSPYNDSPLFYNLVTNRSLENMTKPTNPLAQRAMKEASRRRSSTAIGSSAQTMSLKQMTFPVTKPTPNNKQNSLFDGFEEEDHGPVVDILSPKTSVKKLSMKTVRGMSRLSLPLPSNRSINDTVQLGSVSLTESSVLDNSVLSNRSSEDENANEREADIVGQNTRSSVSPRQTESGDGDRETVRHLSPQSAVDGSGQTNSIHEHNTDTYVPLTRQELERGGEGNRSRVICTVPGYYVQPSIPELDLYTDNEGKCFIRGFCVGRHNYGQVRFLEAVDVAGLNIDELVKFRHKEVAVYPDEMESPPVGQGLNVPAEVHLARVWPFNKKTREHIKDIETIRALKYEDLLRRSCERMDVDFVSYDPEEGVWVFRVKHFSKYSCTPEEEDEDDMIPPAPKMPAKGLGGLTPAQIQLSCPQIPFGTTDQTLQEEDSGLGILEHNSAYKRFQGLDDLSKQSTMMVLEELTLTKSQDISVDMGSRSILENIFFPEDEQGRTDRRLVPMDMEDVSEYEAFLERSGIYRARDDFEEKEDRMIKAGFGQLAIKIPAVVKESDSVCLSMKKPPSIWNRRREEVSRKPVSKPFQLFKMIATDGSSVNVPPRSARVCMGSRGRFVQIMNNQTPSQFVQFNGQVSLNVISNPSKEMINFKQVLTEQLELYVEHSLVSNDTYAIGGPEIILAHAETLSTILGHGSLEGGSSLAKNLKAEREVWKLIEILSGNGQGFQGGPDQELELVQRDRLAKWLRGNGSMLFSTLHVPGDTSVKGYLLKGMRQEAARQATRDKNYTLALCLAQNGLLAKLQLRSQLSYWEQEGALPFVDPDLVELYGLCAGFPIWGDMDLNRMSTSEWLQHFATFVWYVCPPYFTIDEVVVNFQNTVKDNIPDVSEDWAAPALENSDSSLPNLCIHLLKKYSTVGYPMNKLLSPKTLTPDVLDYKVSWFLLQAFLKVGVQIDAELLESITTGFAQQLEMLGMFEWAVYVLKFLPKTEVRQIAVKRLLERHVTPSRRCLTADQFKEKLARLADFGISVEELKECKFLYQNSTQDD